MEVTPMFVTYYFLVVLSLISTAIFTKILLATFIKRLFWKILFLGTLPVTCYLWYVVSLVVIDSAQKIH